MTLLCHDQGDPVLVRRVLDDLPDWFGLPEAVDVYVAEAAGLPMISVRSGFDPIGFATLKATLPGTVEISCMGLLRAHQGQGAGRALMAAVAAWARDHGARLLVVRTLGPSDPDPFYAGTRAFYTTCGFLPVAELPEVWGPENPCLIMAVPLDPPTTPH